MSADDPLLDRALIEETRFAGSGNVWLAEEVLALCAEVFPDEAVPARARLVLEDAFGDR